MKRSAYSARFPGLAKNVLICLSLITISACDTQNADNQAKPPLSPQPSVSSATSLAPYSTNINSEQFSSACSEQLTIAKQQFAALQDQPQPYTIETMLRPLDDLYISINNQLGISYLLNHVHPDEDLQNAADQCVQDFSRLLTDMGLSTELFKRLQAVDVTEADSQTQRFHQHLMRDFRRAGVNQDEATRKHIRALNESITELGQQFSKNIRSDVGVLTLEDSSALDGLPEDYIAQHPVQDGVITITTDYPDLFPFLRYSKDDAARKALYQKYLIRAYPSNHKVLKELINKRHELAIALGYANFASYATEVMMVEDPTTVANFIDRINDLAAERATQDYQQLFQALQNDYPAATQVNSWQKAYAEERVKQQQYQIDTKAVREYFQYANVKQGIFTLVEDLFDITIQPWDTPTWHDTVEAYELRENGQVIGRFYLDMHPRPLKYKHAAQFDINSGVTGKQLPVAALVCNFPGGDDPNALMEHRQVETFLHEFGHLLHHIFAGQQQWSSFSGVATERDFVEAPSQMLEEWIWDYQTLQQFAINQQGEVIPEALVEKMRSARDFGRGVFIRNQMFYAALSLNYYLTDPTELDLDEQLKQLQNQYSPFPYMEDTYFYASFGHLYGYSAAYYTYMWSEVIAADILKQFKQQGMRNKALAQKYRQTVLAPGGSKDAAQLVEDFLGRPFNFDAFINNLNRQADSDSKAAQ